ncbi:MAG: bifunctional phosphoribosylaminoimidazolecarboxamide formyltransferase/IMP cyclohydrolase PurH [Bacteroidetes bacterium]|nr:MAG: bifunctional phosphoribosylaminoimidazolecarboxamide formyltransferase/IMP cyclohydrolase PurH [Bacteroidota bacterium]
MDEQNFTQVRSALISLFHKEPAKELILKLHENQVKIYSTGGTLDYIRKLGIEATPVEELTQYPSVFGGRVKTLHPKIFGGILYRRDNSGDLAELDKYNIPPLDLVMVDLYPFEETVKGDASHQDIIEKIDIGGISLIRAAAKNYQDTLIIPSAAYYPKALEIIKAQGAKTTIAQRKEFAAAAFHISSHYDTLIFSYLADNAEETFKKSFDRVKVLRYGENPHQKGYFFGDLEQNFTQLHGKEISYNNLLDIDAAIGLIAEFDEPTFIIIKHTNACGAATRENIEEAYRAALASDPVSAFGGILIANRNIERNSAYDINELFFEVILAPDYSSEAMEILQQKKNRIILKTHTYSQQEQQFRSVLNGVLTQSANFASIPVSSWKMVTENKPEQQQIEDLLFANILVKHTKSNAVVLAKNKQLLASGTGQTSRVDSLKQAIVKAREFGHDLNGAVMASDAFFPFADCVEIANGEGIKALIQPGGSVRDQESIDYCNENRMSMVFTGIRHFKH